MNTKARLRTILVAVALLAAVSQPRELMEAQGVCVISERKLSAVKGRVAFPNDVPIPNASLELREKDSSGSVVAQGKSDDTGRFELANVKPGKYVLVAKAEMLSTLYVPLRITAVRSPKDRRTELLIRMNGFVDKPCGGGYVELVECHVK
jgi:hypothetical protein